MTSLYLVVWEKFSTQLQAWTPYSPHVSRLLDRAHYKGLTRAELGDAEPELSNKYVNLLSMQEFGPKTTAPVRRTLYAGTEAIYAGVYWKFYGDNWCNIPYEMQHHIEMAWLQGRECLELMIPESRVLCLIDLKKMCMFLRGGVATFSIKRTCSIPYSTLKHWSHPKSTPGTDPVDVPVGWGPVAVAPQQQQAVNGGQCEKPVTQMTTGNGPATSEVELDLVHSLAKRLSNFLLGKSSDASASSRASTSEPNGTPKTVDEVQPYIGTERKTMRHTEALSKALDSGYIKLIEQVPRWMQPCPVCQLDMLWGAEKPTNDYPVAFGRCQHIVHSSCFMQIIQLAPEETSAKLDFYFECPTCDVIYGRKIGCQPPGSMVWELKRYHLPGHEGTSTIEIVYDFQSSVQNRHQPRPGKQYFAVGFPRRCFLPYDYHGKLILSYLMEAFDRRILFTIGRSATTGVEDVVQPCVEHKTRVDQFPDSLFFQRCIQQLVNLGVAD